MKYRPELTQSLLRDFVHYDPDTGVLKRTHALDRGHNRFEKEFVPRSTTLQGYLQIGLFKTPYLVHRLAFLYMVGRMPNEIDHIDGDRQNNKWSNLREVTSAVNRRNMGIPVNNRSGVRGVYFYPRYGKWEVTIGRDGEHFYLGRYDSFDEAVAVRHAAEKDLDFHQNHGKRASWGN